MGVRRCGVCIQTLDYYSVHGVAESDTPERLKHGSSHRKEWSAAVCSGMDAPGESHTQVKQVRQRHRLHVTTHIRGPETMPVDLCTKTRPSDKKQT